jgi:archaellum component FlaC
MKEELKCPSCQQKDKEIAELKAELSSNADEGYIGFLLGIEQMKKKLAEKDKEIEQLKEVMEFINVPYEPVTDLFGGVY